MRAKVIKKDNESQTLIDIYEIVFDNKQIEINYEDGKTTFPIDELKSLKIYNSEFNEDFFYDMP